MDIFNLGIDVAIVAGIIGITEVVKSFLPEKLKRFTILIPTVLGVVAAVVIGWNYGWAAILKNCIMYVGSATYIWRFGKSVIANQ